MLIQDTDFPIIRMHYNLTDPRGGDASFALFDQLLNQPRPFVLIGFGGSDEAHEHSPEERKRVALFMKEQREPLRRLVKAMVYVEPVAAKRFVAKAQTLIFAKAWGFPMLVAKSEPAALEIADRLLAGETAATIADQVDA